MKKITAYFNDSAKARSAAFDLSESGGGSGDILVGSVAAEKAQLSNFVFTGLFCGAARNLIAFKEKSVCRDCIRALNKKADD